MIYADHLRIFAEIVEGMILEKKIAVALWLEGVVAGQRLDQEERQNIVKAVNNYTDNLEENGYDKGSTLF